MRLKARKLIKWIVLIVLAIPYSLCVLGSVLAESMQPFIEHIHQWSNPGKYTNFGNRWYEK